MMMNVGAKGHLFCSAMQFTTRCELLVCEVEDDVKEEDVMEGEKAFCKSTIALNVKTKALHYV